MQNKTTVIYHKSDFDGIFCKEIAKKFLPDAELIGWEYGEPPIPFSSNHQFYVLDLSPECFGIKTQEQIEGTYWNKITWIDHHKSAIEKYPSTIPGHRIDGVAACRLAWQWFYLRDQHWDQDISSALPSKEDYINRKVDEPLSVRLAGEYDIWDKRDPDAELFQHGLRSQELSENMWDLLLVNAGRGPGHTDVGTVAVEALLECGKAIQYAKTQENAGIIKAIGFDLEWHGLRFLACNHAQFNSFLFTAGIKPEHDALLGFKWTGKDWSCSLYHAPGKEHHDLSLIAVKHGGGGHKGACGFRAKTLPWL